MLFLLWVDRRFKLRRPALFALYVAVYCVFRTYEETLRIDPSNHFLGQRINFWVSLVLLVSSLSFFYWWQFRRDETRPPKPPKARKAPERKPRPRPKGPNMAVPRGRVR